MFCNNCGNQLTPNDGFCPKCGKPNGGVPTQTVQPNQYQQPYPQYGVQKAPGSGASTAGMVLGIIAIVYSLITILAVMSDDFKVEALKYSSNIGAFAFGIILIQTVLAVTGLPLSISGMTKHKNGKNLTGVILNSITILVSIILFVYILVNY